MSAAARYAGDFERVLPTLPGAGIGWLTELRRESIERFAARGFPTTRDESWKYTSVAPIESREFSLAANGGNHVLASDIAPFDFAGPEATLLTFIDGRFAAPLSRLSADGVEVRSLADTLARTPDRLEPYLGTTGIESPFAALNTAFMGDGAVILLPADTRLAQPVHLLFFASEESRVSHLRNVIIAAPGSEAAIVEHYVGSGGYFTNALTTIVLEDNTGIEHCKLQQESAKGFHIAGVHVEQKRDSRFTSHSIALGAQLSRTEIATRLAEPGSECQLNGLYMAGGRSHVDHHTRIDHASPHGTSREFYRGILSDAARAVFVGSVLVRPDAQQTDAQQSNHNLLLSKNAEVDTKPQLEIYADDVKCAHGATVGQLDESAVFYLRSRGLSADVARSLLTYAFAHDIINRVQSPALRRHLAEIVLARLPQGELIRDLL